MSIPMKDLLLYHIEHTFEKEAMQASLLDAVRGLTASQAAWKPSPDRHSIWQIVRHVIHWKEGAIAALDGHPFDYDVRNRMDWQEVSGDQDRWDADVEGLGAISREIWDRAQAMDEERLAQAIKWYQQSPRPRPIATRLLEIATHDIYHAGQIQYVFALQEIPVEEFAMAASRNNLSRLQRLLANDKDVINGYSRDGWAALHVACYFAQTEAVEFLLAHGASPNAVSRNQEGKTSLHVAVTGIGRRAELVRALLQHGVDAAVQDATGKTAYDLALERGDAEVADLLRGSSRTLS